MTIDIEKLRRDLIDYYGTAAVSIFAPAFLDVSEAEEASPEELIRMAEDAGFDLRRYCE